jgi:3-deoxy-D-manno-octulosonic acid (KDO) 8-phosphate synthase
VFAEIHENPERAKSDAATQLPLSTVPHLLGSVARIVAATRG